MRCDSRRASLRERVRATAENRPGVYRWLAADGTILYVGKSVRLRSRLLSYFRADAGKAVRLVAQSTDLRWDYAPNEFAALLREMRLIRAWQPEFNVQHKRDRRYGFIRMTRESAPRIVPVARVRNDGARYYGPFAQRRWLARAVHELSLATGLRDCAADVPIHFADQLELFAAPRTPYCLRGETGSCPAPCAGGCTTTEYGERVALVRDFLEARDRMPLAILREGLEAAAARLEFEYAARIRDRIEALEKLWSHLAGFRGRIGELNLIYPVPGFGGDDRIYLIRRGRAWGEIPPWESGRERGETEAVVRKAMRPAPSDRDASLDADAAAEVLLTVSWFNRRPGERRRAVEVEEWLATPCATTGDRNGRCPDRGPSAPSAPAPPDTPSAPRR